MYTPVLFEIKSILTVTELKPSLSSLSLFVCISIKKACFKTLVDEVQELEALSKDPGAVVHGKR